MIDVRAIARHYGGTVTGSEALIPTLGHSAKDRGTAIKADPSAPDGCLIHCFNGGDALAEKDRLRADGFLPKFEPKAKADLGPWKPTATFEYADANGEVTYRTVRREPQDWAGPDKRPKEFRAERFEGGRWITGVGNCERVPYRLTELRQAINAGEVVYLVEGETKADKLCEWGLAGTAIAFGAKGWRADYAQHFAGARVVILPDNDEPGRDFARRVYTDLKDVALPLVVELPGLPPAGDIIDWKGTAEGLEALSANAVAPDWLDQALPTMNETSTFPFVAVGSLEFRPPRYLIEGMIEEDTVGMFFGDPGSGKTFSVVDVGLCTATGAQFHGRTVKQGSVFYIAGEGHNGLARRFHAWSRARGLPLDRVPLFKSERAAQFLDKESAQAVAESVQALATEHGDPTLIIIDTLARNFGAGDESSTRDMSEFIAAVDGLKAQFKGCTVLIVHHSGHADKQRARGAMALKGALDFEYRIEKQGDILRMVCTKMKDAPEPDDLAFAFRTVQIDAETTSATLEETNASPRKKPLTPAQRLGLETFAEAAASAGQFDGETFEGLALSAWLSAFVSRHTGDNDDSKKRALRRTRADLVEAGFLTVENDNYHTENADLLRLIETKRTERT